MAFTVITEPEVLTVSQFDPFRTIALAPTVAPAGTPDTCRVPLAGAGPFKAWLNVSDVGVTAIVPVATKNVTGIVCAGTFGEELEMLIVPI